MIHPFILSYYRDTKMCKCIIKLVFKRLLWSLLKTKTVAGIKEKKRQLFRNRDGKITKKCILLSTQCYHITCHHLIMGWYV